MFAHECERQKSDLEFSWKFAFGQTSTPRKIRDRMRNAKGCGLSVYSSPFFYSSIYYVKWVKIVINLLFFYVKITNPISFVISKSFQKNLFTVFLHKCFTSFYPCVNTINDAIKYFNFLYLSLNYTHSFHGCMIH